MRHIRHLLGNTPVREGEGAGMDGRASDQADPLKEGGLAVSHRSTVLRKFQPSPWGILEPKLSVRGILHPPGRDLSYCPCRTQSLPGEAYEALCKLTSGSKGTTNGLVTNHEGHIFTAATGAFYGVTLSNRLLQSSPIAVGDWYY